jgi:hypothetical protein
MYTAIVRKVGERQEASVKVAIVNSMFPKEQQLNLHCAKHQIHCCVATEEYVKR